MGTGAIGPTNDGPQRRTMMRLILNRSRSLGRAALIAGMAALPMSLPAMAQQHGGTLIAAFSADPAGFDPVRGPSGMSHVVIEQVYSTLMLLDPDANPIPGLAESYEMSPDGKEYTFKLRDGVTFHNGDPLTAEDVKFSFDRLRAPDSGYSYGSQVETIDEVEVVDPLTVKFKLRQVTGPFLIYMAFPGSSIVPKKLVESGHDLNAQPIGSGPFKFVSYQPRSAIKFERNPNYYEEGKPYFDAMEYRIISDITALTNAVMSGVVNFSNEIPPKDWATVQSNPDLVGKTIEGSRYYWLLPNNTKPPLDNPKVRQAVAHAIDRQALVTGAFFGQATPILGGVVPQWNWGYADLGYFSPRGDAAKAKQLLAEAGHPDGFETSMTIASSFPAMVAMAPIIQANLAGGRHQEHDRHHGDPALLGRGLEHQQLRHHHDVLAEPARRSGRLRHQQLQVRHGDQRAEVVQQGDGRHPRAGQGRAHPGGAQGTVSPDAGALARGDGHRAAGQRLDPDRAHQEPAELQADADRLSEDVEGRLVRIAADPRRTGRSDRTPARGTGSRAC